MARRPPHLRWIYVKDHPRPFLALVAVTVLALAAVAFSLSDPARGLSLGAIPVAFGAVVWALTNRAGYPDRDPASLPHERHEAESAADQSTPTVEAEGADGEWDPFAGQRKSVAATAAPADPFEQSTNHPPTTDPAAPSDRRKGPSGKTTLTSRETEPERAESAPAVAREPQVRKTHPRRWDDKPAKPKASPDRTAKKAPKEREGASQKRREEARADSTVDAGGGALTTKHQARQQKAAVGQGSKKSPGTPADGGKAQQGGGSDQPDSADGGEPAVQPLEPLSPAEAAIQAAAAHQAKRHRKTG